MRKLLKVNPLLLLADQQLVTLLIGILVALGGGVVQGIYSKDKWTAFFLRQVVAIVLGGIVCYGLLFAEFNPVINLAIAFACGFRSREIAAILSNIGTSKTKTLNKGDGVDDASK